MNLTNLFDDTFRLRAGKPALEFERQGIVVERLTFGEIDNRTNRLARILKNRAVGRGDRVAMYLSNRTEVILLYLACVRLGVILVPVNILYREREIAHILTDSTPVAIVTEDVIEAVNVPQWNLADLMTEAASESGDSFVVETDDATPAAVVYTSGTTGRSKGAVLTHGAFAANAQNLRRSWEFTENDRLYLPLPLFHVHGLGNGLHTWLSSGCLLRLANRFDHRHAAASLLDFKPSVVFGVPTVYTRLLEIPEDAARVIGSHARLFVSGSAPLPVHVHEAFRTRFGHTILERYGMTETLMTLGNPYDGDRVPGSVGVPFPGVEVRIVDEQEHDVEDGVCGELLVRTPTLFAGYWRNEEATAAAFTSDGWFRTSDLAVRSEGRFTLRGRKSDLIISGGFNIFPREIEELLLEQPGVREAVVVGVPDELRGERPVAFVVADGFDAEALEAACRASLASFKIPRAFLQIDSIPRTALGKAQKHLLLERVDSQVDAMDPKG